MKITLEDDDGRKMSLDTALKLIPSGHVLLICPVAGDVYLPDHVKVLIERQLEAWGIRALVVQQAVHVWGITDPNAPA